MNEDVCHLPVMPHSSQVKTRATCNCGRKQGEREDPFDHRVSFCLFVHNSKSSYIFTFPLKIPVVEEYWEELSVYMMT